ncbi:MAG: CDP-alcohol phosphatidyltransferase family protein [Promicromonosporaceae bacterium]|nr:CDP-alcohol phosphatidyltransferase family protein [Promicromonosporaceae bacterium]
MLRLALVPVFGYLIFQQTAGADWVAVGVLMVSGITDWLDGFLARRLNQTSRLGQVLDPAADRLFILVTLLGLAWREVVPWWLVAVLLGREAFMAGWLLALARRGYGPLEVNFVGKAGTLCLLYAFPLLLLSTIDGPLGEISHITGWAFSWWGVGLYWLAAATYVQQARRILRLDREPAAALAGEGA